MALPFVEFLAAGALVQKLLMPPPGIPALSCADGTSTPDVSPKSP
jgi:hypothetical protein